MALLPKARLINLPLAPTLNHPLNSRIVLEYANAPIFIFVFFQNRIRLHKNPRRLILDLVHHWVAHPQPKDVYISQFAVEISGRNAVGTTAPHVQFCHESLYRGPRGVEEAGPVDAHGGIVVLVEGDCHKAVGSHQRAHDAEPRTVVGGGPFLGLERKLVSRSVYVILQQRNYET